MECKPIFSIILPTCNPNKDFFIDCINSIQNQTFKSFELIIIANGCDSKHLFEIQQIEYLETVRIITEPKLGVSKARNIGILEAQGDYIVFVDDDDALNPYFLESSFKYLKQKVDLICFFETTNKCELNSTITTFNQYNKKEIENSFFNNKNKIRVCDPRPVWGKVYKKSIILENNIYFSDNLLSEDILFNLAYANKSNTMVVFSCPNEFGYFYRIRQSSLSHGFKKDAVELFDNFNCVLADILRKTNHNDDYLFYNICDQLIYHVSSIYFFNRKLGKTFFKRMSMFKHFCKKELYKKAIKKVKVYEMHTTKKKALLFLLKCHLYFLSSFLLYVRYTNCEENR